MRIAMGALGDFTAAFEPTEAQSTACSGFTGFFDRLFQGAACQGAGSPGATLPAQSLPNDGAPTTTISSAPIAGMVSSYAGVDANGNPIYVNTPSADQQQASNVAAITAAASSALAAADANSNSTAPDCTTFFNEYFNPACPSVLPSLTSLLIFVGVAFGGLFLITYMAEGGNRR